MMIKFAAEKMNKTATPALKLRSQQGKRRRKFY